MGAYSLGRQLDLPLTVVIAAIVGAIAATSPLLALGVALVSVAACLLFLGSHMSKMFLVSLAAILAGYAFLDKGFAYIGVHPVYVSEVVLFLAGLQLILRHRHLRPTALNAVLLAFMGLGLLRTFPYLEQYGLDALRDGVIWGYGLFALALAATLGATDFSWITRAYVRAIPVFLVWLLVAGLVAKFSPAGQLPNVPGSEVSILTLKNGDMGVHLAGIAAFILAGLNVDQLAGSKTQVCLWFLWLLNFGVQGSGGRASMLAASVGFIAAVFLVPPQAMFRRIAVAVVLAALVAAIVPGFDVGNRRLSVEQVANNIVSIVTDSGTEDLEGTKVWRQIWWNQIIDYTLNGPYFWTGKGFGINLAVDDAIRPEADPLRSPHNSHLTVLARMGVPGLAAWILLQVLFGGSLAWSFLRARRHRASFWCQIDAWLLVYWLAFMVNASFDVFFEGPQGGIWFWTVFGMGLAAIQIQRSMFDAAESALESSPVTATSLVPARSR